MQHECFPEETEKELTRHLGDKAADYVASLESFSDIYQPWYSEAKVLIRQLLPERFDDFVRHYEKPQRKELTYESYRIEDYPLFAGTSMTKLRRLEFTIACSALATGAGSPDNQRGSRRGEVSVPKLLADDADEGELPLQSGQQFHEGTGLVCVGPESHDRQDPPLP